MQRAHFSIRCGESLTLAGRLHRPPHKYRREISLFCVGACNAPVGQRLFLRTVERITELIFASDRAGLFALAGRFAFTTVFLGAALAFPEEATFLTLEGLAFALPLELNFSLGDFCFTSVFLA